MTSNPSDYNIAIRKDGKEFRVSRYMEKLPEEYFLVTAKNNGSLRNIYFTEKGELRAEYWILDRIR